MLAGQVCGAGTQNAATSYISFVLSFVDTYLTFQILNEVLCLLCRTPTLWTSTAMTTQRPTSAGCTRTEKGRSE